MNRLSGWQRLGVVISIAWFAGTIGYFWGSGRIESIANNARRAFTTQSGPMRPELDIPRIKENIRKLVAAGAQEADVDAYVAAEGTTAEELRAHPPVPRIKSNIKKLVDAGAAPPFDPTKPYEVVVPIDPTKPFKVITDIVARCEEPKGWRASYGDWHDLLGKPIISTAQGILWERDGFSNMNPVVVWRAAKPNVLFVWWGSTIPDELLGKVEADQHLYEATVIHNDENVVQALRKTCEWKACNTVYLYSFFLKLNFLTVTVSGTRGFMPADNMAVKSLFAAKCRRMN